VHADVTLREHMALASATCRARVRNNCFRADTKASLFIHYGLKEKIALCSDDKI
jgi:hypothetical protein